MHVNVECKARVTAGNQPEEKLLALNPFFKGEDAQTDTYFVVPNGRLKLREGNIENALIHYNRPDTADNKQSDVHLYHGQPGSALKELLTAALGVKVVVAKKRRIYFINNVKFHFDEVAGLGRFVEIEAIDTDGSIGLAKLQEQCAYYATLLGIQQEDYIAVSYSDLLMG